MTLQAADNAAFNNGGGDKMASATATILNDDVAANQPPTATNLSAAETYVEDTTLNLVNIVASDVDNANVTATLTLSNTAAGSLTTGTSGAVTSTYVPGTGVWTASGAIADVNALLAGVSFVPAANFNANFTIATSVSDGALSVTGSKAVTGTPVNDAPSFIKGANQTVLEDAGAQSVSGWATAISAGPANESGQAVDFIVSNNNNALFAVQPAVTPTGTLTYTPAGNANGSATVSVQIHDNGGVLNGGVDTSAVQTFTITVTPVNDAPTATNLSAAETYVEDTTLNLVNIVASDVDSANVTATLTLSNTAAGSLTTAHLGRGHLDLRPGHRRVDRVGRDRRRQRPPGRASASSRPSNFNANFTIATSVSDGAPRRSPGPRPSPAPRSTTRRASSRVANQTVLEDAGAQQRVRLGDSRSAPGPANESGQAVDFIVSNNNNALFAVQPAVTPTGTLTYTPAGNANGSATVSVQIHDNGGVLNGGVDTSAVQTFTITVTPVNDAPTATNLSAAETYVEDTTLNLVNIVASDVDSANVTATLTLSNPAAGSLTTGTSGAVTSTYVPGTGVWTASGAIADVNALLAGVSFAPAAQLQRELHDRDQRVRRRPVGHRVQGRHRHPGQRRPRCRDHRRLQRS